MKSLLIVLLLLSLYSINFLNAQSSLYTFDLTSPRVNINGQPHFKVNYYPNTANSNYKGDFYPDLESNPNVAKYTFTADCVVSASTDYRVAGFLTPTYTNSYPAITSDNVVLIVPVGVTVTIRNPIRIPALIIKGRVILDPTMAAKYQTKKTIIMPGGVLESVPKSLSYNHSFVFQNFEQDVYPAWDPLRTACFISLGGNFTTIGLDSTSTWTGSNSSFTSYGGTFIRSFPFSNFLPVFKMSGTRVSNNVQYTMNNYFNTLVTSTTAYASDSTFGGGGYIFMRPWSKNIWIWGNYNSSMVFTGGSNVNIQHSVFMDIGHTSPSPIVDSVLDSNLNLVSVGSNLPDRYPITLLHNTVAVNINNNMFMPNYDYTVGGEQLSTTPRAFIGAKRSFGSITGNAFALKRSISGISLLYGTEQFNVSQNAFISLYTDSTTPTTRSYPDIDYLNGGIVTTSPYSTYEENAFEGTFKGGAFQVLPIQNRAAILGLSSDLLLGKYAGLSQDNTADHQTNNVWNSVVYRQNFFAGEAEFRVTYPLSAQPPIRINFLGGWFIGQRASITLPPNVANIEMFYDSPYIANTLSINDKWYLFNPNSHTGTYNAVSIKNSIAIATYTFFADSFKCKYVSIRDSIFSHYSGTSDFIKKYTDQLYFSNVNGTKTNTEYDVLNFYPLFNLSPTGSGSSLPNNKINISFIPNFDYSNANGQAVNYLVNDQVVDTDPNLFLLDFTVNVTSHWKVINFPLANGPYNVMVSSRSYVSYNSQPYTLAGPYFANTYIVDSNVPNFYLGLDLNPTVAAPRRALSIFGNSWTKCSWVSANGKCTTTGLFKQVATTPSSVVGVTGDTVTASDSVSMLTSYLVSDTVNGIPSTVNITLSGNQQYKFFIYSYNPSFSGSNIVYTLPLFTIKVGGKYQEPFNRPVSTFGKYQKFGPFYWNNALSTDQVLSIQWASENTKFEIPISGIEIFSSISSPYSIPIDV